MPTKDPWFSDALQLLIDTVQDYAIFMIDPEGYVMTWNRGAERIKGYRADEIVGKHFSRFYSVQDVTADKPGRELEIARRDGRVEDEGFRVRKDGSLFWANVVITALHDKNGRLRAFAKITRDLSMRRAAEEQLRRSEERFRTLIEAVRDYAIYMLDPSGNITTWNSGAEQLKGYRADEVIGRHFSMFFPEADAQAGKPRTELTIAAMQGRFEEEGIRVRKDGSTFLANVVVTPVRSQHGTLLGFAKVTRDLTARVSAEQIERKLIREQAARAAAESAETRARDSEERYRALSRRLQVILESVADGIAVQDRSTRVVFANSAAAKSAGFASLEAFLDAAPNDIVTRFELLDEHGSPLDPNALPGRRVLRGAPANSRLIMMRDPASRREAWVLAKSTPVLSPDGEPEFAVNIWHDVTEARRREQHNKFLAQATGALACSLESDAMLAAFARALVPGFADWCSVHLVEADELRFTTVAHADEQKLAFGNALSLKYPPQKNQARGLWGVIRTGTSELFAELPDALLVDAASDSEHLAALRSVQMKSAMIVAVRVRDQVVGALTLISAEGARCFDAEDLVLAEELGRRAGDSIEHARLYRQAHEAARLAKEAAKQAEQANRLKDEFLATVSHELRTPLNSIVGWASVLREQDPAPALSKGLEIIHRSAVAQGKIIEDILDVSRIITGKLRLELKPTDLSAITQNAIEVIRPAAAAKKLSVEFEPVASAMLIADPERLQQVVWNLLSNAVKFSQSGGALVITIRHEASNLELTVRDNGAGIDPEFLPYVFDRFKQADGSSTRRVGGLGLGLAIVRHLVELHGGQVEATSAGRGNGATFIVTLPVRAVLPVSDRPIDVAAKAQSNPAAPALAGVLAGKRVLVVDDEPDARELLEMVLSNAGAAVQTAASGQEGMALIQRFRPHVLVSDIGMPDEDGYAFMRRVKTLDQSVGGGIPSLALTAYTRNDDRARALSAGFTAHLAKPVDPADLIAAVTDLAGLVPG